MTPSIQLLPKNEYCNKHGPYESSWVRFANRWSECPTCIVEQRAADERRWQAERRREMINGWLAAAEIPPKFEAAKFDDGLPERLRAWTAAAIGRSSTGPLVIIGPVGVGKTHAACGALSYVIAKTAAPGHYLATPNYCRRIRDTWTRRSEDSESRLLDHYALAPFLILDEFGAGREADASLLQDLIAVRYDAGLMPRTVVISNLALANFPAVAGERAADRIREGATALVMNGPSRRQALQGVQK